MPDSRHVFISYSHTDAVIMQMVKQTLLDHQLAVWTDEGIAPGTASWKRAIASAIERASCLVCLLSPAAKNSEWVQRELDYADAQGVPIFPLLARGDTTTSVPFDLIGAQYVDIHDNYAAGMGQLVPVLLDIAKAKSRGGTKVTKAVGNRIPTLEEAPIDYSKIKQVKLNKDWMPIIRVVMGIEMVLVPPGCFMMGSEDLDDAKPVHQRCFDKAFWIGRYPISNAQYNEAVGAEVCPASRYAENRSFNKPQQQAVGIAWYHAWKYSQWKGMRLPTEAEWEYATRGPESWKWPWGNELMTDNLIYVENASKRKAPINESLASASWVGALAMCSNVWEWCLTKWRDSYSRRENNDPAGDAPRVLRGGSWDYDPPNTMAASRTWGLVNARDNHLGFRVVFAPF